MHSMTDLPQARKLIMTFLSAMLEAEKSIRQVFPRQLLKVVFVLCPVYASLPEPSAMAVLLTEGRFDVMIPAPNRQVDPNLYYPFLSELSAIWSAIQGFKENCTTRVVLDEGLGLELSNFGRLMKMRPGVGDEHRLEQRLGNNSCFWQLDYVKEEMGNLVRRNALTTEEDLKALIKRERAGRRDDFSAYAGDKHDVSRPVQGGCAGNESRKRKIRFNPRVNGHGLVTRIHQQLLSSGLEGSNNQLR